LVPALLGLVGPFWRLAAGLVATTVLPGHCLLGLLATHRPFSPRQRAALTIPAGLAVTVLVLLALDYGGLYHAQRAMALLIVSEEALALAWFWRGRPVTVVRLSPPPCRTFCILFLPVLLLLVTVAYTAATPRRPATLTEFYLLGPDGRLPSVAGPEGLRVAITNHEGEAMRYRVVGEGFGADGAIPLGAFRVALAEEGRWQGAWLWPSEVRLESVSWTLFREGQEQAYRRLAIGVAGSSVYELQHAGDEDDDKKESERDDREPQQPFGTRGPGCLNGGE
jgi:hypothetical protein